MIRAEVEEVPVMGDEDEAFLVCEVRSDFVARACIQMVRRLIDQEKGVLDQLEEFVI